MPITFDKLLGEPLLHNHKDSDISDFSVLDSRYLKLDQSTPQTITASPILNWGTQDRIPYYSATKTLTDSSELTFDGTNFATSNIKTAKIFPSSDSTTAIQINKANNSTNVLTIDTTNARVGVGTTSPNYKLEIAGNVKLGTQSYTGLVPLSIIDWTPNILMNVNRNNASPFSLNLFTVSATDYSDSLTTMAGGVGLLGATYADGSTPPSIDYMFFGSEPTFSYSNNTFRLYPDKKAYFAGNVGIGTTSPTSKLETYNTTGTYNHYRLSSQNVNHGMTSVAPTNVFGSFEEYANLGMIFRGIGDSATNANAVPIFMIGLHSAASPTQPAMIYRAGKKSGTSYAALSSTETVWRLQNYTTDLVSVLGSGNVGIGTTSPTTKLDILGGSAGTGIVRIGDVSTDSYSKNGRLVGRHYSNSEEDVMLLGVDASSTNNTVLFGGGYSGQNAATIIRFFTASNNTTTTGTERMRITNTGRVGIGTTSPAGVLSISATDETYPLYISSTNTSTNMTGAIATNPVQRVRSTGSYTVRGLYSTPLINSYDTELTFNASTGVDTTTDTITLASGTVPDSGTKVKFSKLTSETMPGGLSVGTTYYVIKVSSSQMQVETTPGGGAVDITSTGSGTIYCWTGEEYSNTATSGVVGNETSIYTRGLGSWSTVMAGNMSAGHYGPGGRDPLATITNLYGVNTVLYNQPLSTITTSYGNRVNFSSAGGGTWGTLYGTHITFPTAGTITTMYGHYVSASSVSATTKYGLYVGALSGATNNYGIYIDGTSTKSYFAGNVGIGTTSPTISGTGKLHMAADTMRLDTARTITNSTDAGNVGEICWDSDYIYVCVATNTWKRASLSSW